MCIALEGLQERITAYLLKMVYCPITMNPQKLLLQGISIKQDVFCGQEIMGFKISTVVNSIGHQCGNLYCYCVCRLISVILENKGNVKEPV